MDKDKMIIFDFFGVIACEVAPQWLCKHFDGKTSDRIKSEIITLADKNIISDIQLYDKLGSFCNIPASRVLTEWLEIAKKREDVVEFIKRLRNNYNTALLSNAPLNLVQSIIDDSELDEMFDYKVISSYVGMAKPDDDIYEYILNLSQKKGENCVFTDDNQCNLISAEKLGIKTVLFKNLEDFKASLYNLGFSF